MPRDTPLPPAVPPHHLSDASLRSTRYWVGLTGPTAAGKTAAALELAEQIPLEIISVDSALVYRGMTIGTAKPTAAERLQAPHHLIDILDPTQTYSAAQFVADATRLIDEIHARGRLPLLVGGTMLYFKALIDGLDVLPPADRAVRDAIDAEAALDGWPAMHARLASIDPPTAARLAPHDAQRIQRAIEVYRLSGQRLSDLHSRPKRAEADAAKHHLVSLEPTDRAWLHQRIAQRFDSMLDSGLIEEVASLRARGDLRADMPSMRAVGYRQAWEALDSGLTGKALRDQVHERGGSATRQLAKRQITWLRGMQRTAVPADEAGAINAVVATVSALPGKPQRR